MRNHKFLIISPLLIKGVGGFFSQLTVVLKTLSFDHEYQYFKAQDRMVNLPKPLYPNKSNMSPLTKGSKGDFYKMQKFLLGLAGMVVFALGSVSAFVFLHYDDQSTGKAECAVVFGAALREDGTASQVLHDRVMAGVDLFQQGQVDCLVLSGGESEFGPHEVEVMSEIVGQIVNNSEQQTTNNKQQEERVILDFEGANTLATLQNLPANVESFVFVSSGFHLARIGMLAEKLGVEDFYLHPAAQPHGRYQNECYFSLREIVAVIFYFFHFQI